MPNLEVEVFKDENKRLSKLVVLEGKRKSLTLSYEWDTDGLLRKIHVEGKRKVLDISQIAELCNERFIERIGKISVIDEITEIVKMTRSIPLETEIVQQAGYTLPKNTGDTVLDISGQNICIRRLEFKSNSEDEIRWGFNPYDKDGNLGTQLSLIGDFPFLVNWFSAEYIRLYGSWFLANYINDASQRFIVNLCPLHFNYGVWIKIFNFSTTTDFTVAWQLAVEKYE